jgi:hypothetical protein
MRKLPVIILSLSLFPAIAFAQSGGPPPPDTGDIEMARPPDAEPDEQPPAPPAVPPSRAQVSDTDRVGVLQQPEPATAAPPRTGQWVYTGQYGWVWMPYGQQYVDEGTYGAESPYQYVYCVGLGWSWVAAPWLWGWGAYPYFGVWGPHHFGWYRGLYRSGYGWGHYRGGPPRGGGFYAGGSHATRPIGGGYASGARTYGGTRMQGGRTFGAAPRGRWSPDSPRMGATAHGGSAPRATGGFRR